MLSKPSLMAAIRGVSVYPCTGMKIELETNAKISQSRRSYAKRISQSRRSYAKQTLTPQSVQWDANAKVIRERLVG